MVVVKRLMPEDVHQYCVGTDSSTVPHGSESVSALLTSDVPWSAMGRYAEFGGKAVAKVTRLPSRDR